MLPCFYPSICFTGTLRRRHRAAATITALLSIMVDTMIPTPTKPAGLKSVRSSALKLLPTRTTVLVTWRSFFEKGIGCGAPV